MSDIFTIKRTVQFSETDMAGVLHFANYYRYMEEAEHALWRSVGECVLAREGDLELSWPRVATACEYTSPARFEDELDLSVTVPRIGERSVTYAVEFRRNSERIAAGTIKAVCCDIKDGRFAPISIPPRIRELLERFGRATAGSK